VTIADAATVPGRRPPPETGQRPGDPGSAGRGGWFPTPWRPLPTPASLSELLGFLVPALVFIVSIGWASGLVIVRIAGNLVVAAVDGPVQRYFAHHQQGGLASTMALVTQAGSDRVAAMAALVMGLAWWARRRSWIGLQALIGAYLGGTVITVTVKTVVGRGHPVGTGIAALSSSLYPSGHTIGAASVYGMAAALAVLAFGWRRATQVTAMAAGGVIIWVGLALVYVGAHLLTDVLAGAALAGAWVGAVACVVGRDWTARPSLVAARGGRSPAGGTAPRLGTGLVLASGLALFVAVSFAAVGTRNEARGPSARALAASCAPPVRTALGGDAAAPLPNLARACAASAKGQLATSGGLVMAALGLSAASVTLHRHSGRPARVRQPRPTPAGPGGGSPA